MLHQRRAKLYKISSFIPSVVGVNFFCFSCVLTWTLLAARCNYFLATALIRDKFIHPISVTTVGGTQFINPEVAVSRYFSGGGFSDYVSLSIHTCHFYANIVAP